MKRSTIIHICLVLLCAGVAAADSVSTRDGTRLVGTIERIAGGKVVIVTSIAGRLEIPAEQITEVTTEGAVNVEFASGDKLVGTLKAQPSGGVVVESGIGDIEVESGNITTLWPKDQEDPRVVAVREQAQAEIEAAKPKWSVSLEGGFTRTEGNTDTRKAHGRFEAKRTTPDDLLKLFLYGNFSEQNDRRTENEYGGGIRYENDLSELWYWYTGLRLEFDEFEDLDLRSTASAGAGYYWLRQDAHELKTSVGVGYRHETYDTGDTNDDVVLDLGLDYRLDVAPWLQFTHSAIYQPSYDDFDDYRLFFDTAFLIPFQDPRFTWKIGMRNDYNSRPQPGLERLDNIYYTSILVKLHELTSFK